MENLNVTCYECDGNGKINFSYPDANIEGEHETTETCIKCEGVGTLEMTHIELIKEISTYADLALEQALTAEDAERLRSLIDYTLNL